MNKNELIRGAPVLRGGPKATLCDKYQIDRKFFETDLPNQGQQGSVYDERPLIAF
ncbi:MAG: hypothetical protein SPC78_08715 [Candidatus Faecousia sp.]|nr:hypothetical protein [Candidatus Faecousia sp.]